MGLLGPGSVIGRTERRTVRESWSLCCVQTVLSPIVAYNTALKTWLSVTLLFSLAGHGYAKKSNHTDLCRFYSTFNYKLAVSPYYQRIRLVESGRCSAAPFTSSKNNSSQKKKLLQAKQFFNKRERSSLILCKKKKKYNKNLTENFYMKQYLYFIYFKQLY